MSTLFRTDSENSDFIKLVEQLDNYLAVVDGDEHEFYDQYNKIDSLNHVVVAYEEGVATGCGAIKKFDSARMEVKRMFVSPEYRGKGIATKILTELEIWAAGLGYSSCVLETGKRQTEAVNFYKKSGYTLISNYGQYAGVENSICFEKKLI